MKYLFLALAGFSALPAFAASNVAVTDMRLSADTKFLEVDVIYGGGCKEHLFEMTVDSCTKSIPAQCDVSLRDLTVGDNCRALISRTVQIALVSVGLANYYAGQATIETSNGLKTVLLPYDN